MMGIAIWHGTVFLPDRFWGGIVGAFISALVGSIVIGLVANGFSVPGNDDTSIVQALIAIPGAGIGLAIAYFAGVRQEAADRAEAGPTTP